VCPVLIFSWIRSGRLAIGSFPASPEHWQNLDLQGIRQVFSCCAADEGPWLPPGHFRADRLPLPDHRGPDPLSAALLAEAIERALVLYRHQPGGLLLHCWAGQERSPLLAVALLCRTESLNLFSALAQVRRCHPPAQPLIPHLQLLEQLLPSLPG
jgi:hypothetical protein